LIKLPITITEKNGDKSVYADLVTAERSVEAVDVLAHEYAAHDADGKQLKFSIEKKVSRTLFGMIKAETDMVKITE
jgi:hypothetical protein